MNIFVELGIFVALLTIVVGLNKINENPEKFFREEIDWTAFWEDNPNFFGDLLVFFNTLVGLSLWNLVSTTFIGWLVAVIVFFAFAFQTARSLLFGLGGADDEEYIHPRSVRTRCGVLEKHSAKLSFASLAVIVTIVVEMLFFGPLN